MMACYLPAVWWGW